MTFLPIVARELRVAARRKSTYRIRAWTVMVAAGIGSFSLLSAGFMLGHGSLGKSLFTGLSGYAFALCLLAGVLLTADCLSEEKREGTLGLLFLTDLKGYDVVLGKFMAMSLNAFYGLLAILPITGLPLLLGGVTGWEFWRMNLALVNALFFSLATGICVSAFGRDSQRVMGQTLGLVLFLAGGLPALAALGRTARLSSAWECLAWISPYYPFSRALEAKYLLQPLHYWWALLASQLFGWVLLTLASRTLPRRWQERTQDTASVKTRTQCPEGGRRELASRTEAGEGLLSLNPVLWLMSRASDVRTSARGIVGVWGAVVLLATLSLPREMSGYVLGSYGVRLFGFLLKWLLAVQACRFFIEARRNGALEMLLCTPLTTRDILDGQLLALKRTFLWPVVWLLALLFVPFVVQYLTAPTWFSPEMGTAAIGLGMALFACLRMLADCYAVVWFGMALALTLKKPSMAPALTILFVLVLPSVLCVLDVLADVFFIAWGMTKLRNQDLRVLLARQYQPFSPTAPLLSART